VHAEDIMKLKSLCAGEAGSGPARLRFLHFREAQVSYNRSSLEGKASDHSAPGGGVAGHARSVFASVADRFLMRSDSRDSLHEVGGALDREDTSLCDVFGSDPLLDDGLQDAFHSRQTSAHDVDEPAAAAAQPDRAHHGMVFMTADYVALDVEMFCSRSSRSDKRKARSGAHPQTALLVASFATASPPIAAVAKKQILEWKALENAFDNVSGQYIYRFPDQASVGTVGHQRELANAVGPGMARESLSCPEMQDDISLLGRAFGGFKSFAVRTITDLIYRHCVLHFWITTDSDGVPTLVFHCKFKFWGVFETPWRFMSQIGINATPVSFANFKFQQAQGGHGCEVFLIPVFFFNEASQTFGSHHFICRAGASGGSSVSKEPQDLVCSTPHLSNKFLFGPERAPELRKTIFVPSKNPGPNIFTLRFRKVGSCDEALRNLKDEHCTVWRIP